MPPYPAINGRAIPAAPSRAASLQRIQRLLDRPATVGRAGTWLHLGSVTLPAPPVLPRRVLVADDDLAVLGLMAQILEDAGYDVVTARDGAEALERTRATAPDLLLLDVALPVVDGLAVCREIQAAGPTAPPVIFVTGYARTVDRVAGLDTGAVDYIVKPFDAEELEARVRAALRTKAAKDSLAAAALVDPLTGLPNRRHLDARTREAIAFAKRHGRPLACLLVDLDHFKQVNDTFGHGAGDGVLRAVAAQLDAHTRASDVVARYGGDEFVLLLPETDVAGAMAAAEKVRTAVAAAAAPVAVRASIGVACWEPQLAEPDALFAAADAAMYRAKALGRDRVALAPQRHPPAANRAAPRPRRQALERVGARGDAS